MKEQEFTHAVLEELFMQGFSCPQPPLILVFANLEVGPAGSWPDPRAFAEKLTQRPGITMQPRLLGKVPSRTAGACDRGLAVHEAGHAIVGVRAGLTLWGIRFYGDDGFPGETGFEEFHWESSNDEELLEHHIRVNVAANLAEMLLGVREPEGGYPSRFFDGRKPAGGEDYPSDIVSAWKQARRLAIVRFEKAGNELDADALWSARHAIVKQAEVVAEQVLRDSREALDALADGLQRGPMRGTAVRAIIQGKSRPGTALP